MAGHDWDLAGYSGVANGEIAKPIPSGSLLVPGKIWIEQGNLRWELSPNHELRPSDRHAPKTLLNSFVKLWTVPDEQIERFAKSNGVLWLNHNSVDGSEPLGEWRKLSRQTCALLNIGAWLEQAKGIDPNEWKYVGLFEEKYIIETLAKPRGARHQLLLELRDWLNPAAELGFSVAWNRGRKRFELEVDYGGYMLNAVALQLALAISKSDSLYVCSGCGYPYSRSAKRPKSGQANFCEECGTPQEGRSSEALRQADARRRAKMAEAKRLYESGTSVHEIGVQLNVRTGPKAVRSWAKKGNWRAKKARPK